jgi:2-hydroxy-3-keto-5-methylthiopentenyl-1-phosphate phosphatase
LQSNEQAVISDVANWAARIDVGSGPGMKRLAWPREAGEPCVVESRVGGDKWLGAVNLSDDVSRALLPGDSRFYSTDVLSQGLDPTTFGQQIGSEVRDFEVEADGSARVHAPSTRHPAVFCDFDGTFSLSDVGASLAKKFLPERRSDLQRRYERKELGAWDYQVELFEGFAFSSADLDDFLANIELDPGASSLVEWCEDQGIPFRILSDGFDYNLERLRAIHGVAFPYSSNHLVVEEDRWRIAPGSPNPDCGCETGTCKRGIIEAYRTEHPGCYCVHIGDGRVSDLCGAEAADLVFAKGTLLEALRERGVRYQSFENLHSVRQYLAEYFA